MISAGTGTFDTYPGHSELCGLVMHLTAVLKNDIWTDMLHRRGI
jgi:hypothetical protein